MRLKYLRILCNTQWRILNIFLAGGPEKLYVFLTHTTRQMLNGNHRDMEYNPYNLQLSSVDHGHYDKI